MRPLTSLIDATAPAPAAALLFPSIPIHDSAFDIATLFLIACLLLLSILSLTFVFHLRLKSRRAHQLQNFNSLWTIRLLLIAFIAIWALNEIFQLPFFHRSYLYPFLPNLTLEQQSNLCKLHLVLSLGFYEPGFLITLLFLVNVSIKKRNPQGIWAIGLIFLALLPILGTQIFFVFFSPFDSKLPGVYGRSSVLSIDYFDNRTLLCTYPLFSTIVFAAFGIAYCLGFLFTYWRVISLVINKGTRFRINLLAFSLLACLPLQVLFLAASSLWRSHGILHGCVKLGIFVSVAFCAAVGEGILVIKPIADALSAGGECCRLRPPEGNR